MNANIFSRGLLSSTSVGCGLLFAAPTWAQDAPPPQPPGGPATAVSATDQHSSDEPAIVVTGRLVRNPNLTASSPVAFVGAEEIGLRQASTAEEVLRSIPGSVSGFGSNLNQGQTGAATLDLRGLGSNRNIVLLNGARLTPFGLSGVVDTNNIPLALIDRVDVLTGGASTTYGADAVSGVVNFVTKRNFSGVQLSVGNRITELGDGFSYRADLTLGANFDDGRGNAVLNIGYQNQDPIYQGARDFGIFALNPVSGGLVGAGSGTSFPVRISLAARNAAAPGGAASPGTYQLDPATGSFPTSTAFQSYNFNPLNLYQTPFLRYNIFAQAHYQVADAIDVYAEGLFSKESEIAQQAPGGVFAQALTIRYSNPFIPAAALQQICNANGLTPAQCTAAAADTSATGRTFTSTVSRRFIESPARQQDFTTLYFQQRAGVRGSITGRLHYDIYGTYGESSQTISLTGAGLNSRLQQELDATSTTTCRVGGSCFPINLFGGQGSIDPRALDYLNVQTSVGIKTSLLTGHAVIDGDFGLTLPLATNPIGIAIGVEYRRYTASNQSDLPSQTPGEVLGAAAATVNATGRYSVKEAFAETIAPLIEDRPFFHRLTLELGARISDYSTAGSSWTYKAGGNWEPVVGLRLRGSYQRATRAPNVAELYTPVAIGNVSLSVDPCQGAAPTTNANLRAVCIAQGAPAGIIGFIDPPSGGTVNATSGGNPNLGVETANSYTFGAVIQPGFVPGLSVTADYYDIRVRNAITAPTSGSVIAACFSNLTAASATDPACTGIRRDPLTGSLNGSKATVAGLPLGLSNRGLLHTNGIDLTVNYRRDIGFGILTLNFEGNWTDHSQFQATPNALNRDCVGHYSANCLSIQPKFSWHQRTTFTTGGSSLSLLWRHISAESVETTNAAGNAQLVGTAAGFFPAFSNIPAFDYFDLSMRQSVGPHFTLTATVSNIANRKPPIVGQGIGSAVFNSGNTYPATYDTLGRTYLVGASIRF